MQAQRRSLWNSGVHVGLLCVRLKGERRQHESHFLRFSLHFCNFPTNSLLGLSLFEIINAAGFRVGWIGKPGEREVIVLRGARQGRNGIHHKQAFFRTDIAQNNFQIQSIIALAKRFQIANCLRPVFFGN